MALWTSADRGSLQRSAAPFQGPHTTQNGPRQESRRAEHLGSAATFRDDARQGGPARRDRQLRSGLAPRSIATHRERSPSTRPCWTLQTGRAIAPDQAPRSRSSLVQIGYLDDRV